MTSTEVLLTTPASAGATDARPLPAAFQRRDRLPFVGRENDRALLAASWEIGRASCRERV